MKIFRFLLVLAVVAAFSGCIKVDQTLTISENGSGMLNLSYSMKEQTIQQMESMSQMQGAQSGSESKADEKPFDFDPESVKKELEKFKDQGITVKSVTTESANGWKTMNVKLAFDDLASLAKTDFFKENKLTLKKNAEGNYVFKQASKSAGAGAEMDDKKMDDAMIKQMAPMFAGMKISHSIQVPGKILSSNATKTEGNTASWVFDVDKDPSVLAKIKDMNMEIVFEGADVELPDMN